MRHLRKGFTLIELLVVIAIIAILVALLLPAVQQVREAARKSQCQDHLHNLAIALADYEITHKVYPPGGFREGVNQGTGMSWHVAILPFVEQKPLYDRFDFNVTAYLGTVASAPANNVARYNAGNCREPIDLFFCPSGNVLNTQNTGENPSTGGTATSTHYYGVMGPKSPPSAGTPLTPKINGGNYPAASATGGAGHGGFATTGVLRKQVAHAVRDVTDGTSNTFVIGEISWNKANTYRIWLRGAEGSAHGAAKNIENPINKVPYNGSNNFNDVSFGSEHPGGAQFSLLDGKITFASENIDMGIYRALGSRAEGEPARAP